MNRRDFLANVPLSADNAGETVSAHLQEEINFVLSWLRFFPIQGVMSRAWLCDPTLSDASLNAPEYWRALLPVPMIATRSGCLPRMANGFLANDS